MPSTTCTILIADDDQFVRDDLADLLNCEDFQLSFAKTAAEVRRSVKASMPDLVLLDIKFPDSNDLSVLKYIKDESPDTEVIIISSQTVDISQIVEAIKMRAYDYVPKPIVPEELFNRIAKVLEFKRLKKSQAYLLNELEKNNGADRLIGSSSGMELVRGMIAKLSSLQGCVLIHGESGTGKELVARALHYQSIRRASPLMVVNCASIPEHLIESILFGHSKGAFTGAGAAKRGIFEAAREGTIFLDEIGDMPLAQQPSLLRVLEYRRFTPVGSSSESLCRARFIFATNRDLREDVRKGTFREDLYFRIKVAMVSLPPLRSRLEDIKELAENYCRDLAAEMGRKKVSLHPDVLRLMESYDWPGNVRELRNVIEAALMLGDVNQDEITPNDLPSELLAVSTVNASIAPPSKIDGDEREKLLNALRASNGNQTKAAKILGCHRNTLRGKIRQMGIDSLI